jgi:starvation-inducible DNA-binding protein
MSAGVTTRIHAMKKPATANKQDLVHRRNAPLATPTDLKAAATRDITGAMNAILADVFALYLKTKNFHWHMSGRIFAITIFCLTNMRTRSSQ